MFGPMRKSSATGPLAAFSVVVSPFAVVIVRGGRTRLLSRLRHQRPGRQAVEWKITQIGRQFCPIDRRHYHRLTLLGHGNRPDQQK